MVDVPSILYVGDTQINGYDPSGFGANVVYGTLKGDSALDYFRSLDLSRVIPDDGTTGSPIASALSWYPWYESTCSVSFRQVSSSTPTSITVAPSPGWTVDEYKNRAVTICNPTASGMDGFGFETQAIVTSNTADTVNAAFTTTPTPGAYFFFGDGRWNDYHPIAGWLTPVEMAINLSVPGPYRSNRGGSTWPAFGKAIGPDAGMMWKLWQDIYPTSPWFQFWKWAQPAGAKTWTQTGAGTQQAAFTSEKAIVNAAWAAQGGGNTLAWDLLVLDCSTTDIQSWIANPGNYLTYKADLEATIAFFRTELGNASLKVLLVSHDEAIRNVSQPGVVGFANGVHREVANDDPLVRVVDLSGLKTAAASNTAAAQFQPSSDRVQYAPYEYWETYADRVMAAYSVMLTGTPSDIDGSLPVYILLGDSISVGEINDTFLEQLDSPTITRGTRPNTQLIYHAANGVVEAYNSGDNSNTSGTNKSGVLGAPSGPECSMMVELAKLHPEGFVLIKRGMNASSLAAELAPFADNNTANGNGGVWIRSVAAENWDNLKDDYDGCLSYLHNISNRQADLRGIFVVLGTNDQAVAGGGEVFAAALSTFVADLRSTFASRTSGTDLPILWRKPQLTTGTAIASESVTIRAALTSYAKTDAQFILIDADDLERVSDNIHETPEAAITMGQRFVANLKTIAI